MRFYEWQTEQKSTKQQKNYCVDDRKSGEFSAIIFAVDFRFSLCYTKPTEKAKNFSEKKKK